MTKFKVKPIEEARLTLCDWIGEECATPTGPDCLSCVLHNDHQYAEYTHKEALAIIAEINKESK